MRERIWGRRRGETGAAMIVVWCVRIILVAAFLLIWQYGGALLAWLFGSSVFWWNFFSSPTEIASALVKLFTTAKIFPQIVLTVVETLSAFAIGIAPALLFGALLGASSCVTVVLRPFIKVLDAVPRLVLMPVFVIALGLGMWSKIAFGAFLAFSVVLVEICECLSRLPAALPAAAAGGSPSPASSRWSNFLDAWITGLRPAMRFCFAGVVIGEYLGSNNGLGFQVEAASQMFDMPTMYAALVLLTAIAAALDAFAAKSCWTAILACFGKYAAFHGRASRSELWYFLLFYVLANFLIGVLAGDMLIPRIIVALGLFLPMLAVQVRRLHDVGQPGVLVLIGLVPIIGQFALLFWFCSRGNPDKNQYGEALPAAA
jgi:NitT/TauT family transport system permease protein